MKSVKSVCVMRLGPVLLPLTTRSYHHLPPSSFTLTPHTCGDLSSSHSKERTAQHQRLMALRQQGTEVGGFAQTFWTSTVGLDYNESVLKDFFNVCLDDPLPQWEMEGLRILDFWGFVRYLHHQWATPDHSEPFQGFSHQPWPSDPTEKRRLRRKRNTNSTQEPAPFQELTESTPEPAPFQELTESTPVPAPFQELTESTPKPAPFQELTESAPEPAPVQELTESTPEPAPFQELEESAPEPAPFQKLEESAPEPAPFQELEESAPEPAPFRSSKKPLLSPLRSGSSKSPL